VDAASEDIRCARVLVVQMEILAHTVQRAVEVASAYGTRVVLNLAPARELPESHLQVPDPLVVNEHEASFLLRRPVGGVESCLEAASRLLSLGLRSAVLTLGAAGAVVATNEGAEHLFSTEGPRCRYLRRW
jgi:ribokinase